ncbi:hypothetical protein JCM19238_3475 [Vibrio ponticus]|nr:hypothetical protein JCM19238_3475 [Vibrio ponticus]
MEGGGAYLLAPSNNQTKPVCKLSCYQKRLIAKEIFKTK